MDTRKKGDDKTLLKMTNDMASDPEFQKAMQTDHNKDMFEKLESALPHSSTKDLTFELIQHRFTKPAKMSLRRTTR